MAPRYGARFDLTHSRWRGEHDTVMRYSRATAGGLAAAVCGLALLMGPAGTSKLAARRAGRHAAGDATLRKTLQARYDILARGIRSGSIPLLEQVETANYARNPARGRVADRRAANRRLLRPFDWPVHIDIVTAKVTRVQPQRPTVLAEAVIFVHAFGKPPEGGTRYVSVTITERDTWVKTAQGWKMRFTQELKQDLKSIH